MSKINKIIIIEDKKAISKILAQKLKNQDFKIKISPNGVEAWGGSFENFRCRTI